MSSDEFPTPRSADVPVAFPAKAVRPFPDPRPAGSAVSAVSAVGLLGFVGLIVPHIVRLVVGTSHALLIPGSIVLGAALVTISDTVSRTLFSPVEIPVGIMMAVMGVPFFLFLLRRAL